MKALIFLSPLLLLPLCGCALHGEARHEQVLPPTITEVVIEPPTPTTAGSLWTEGRGGLFYDLKARRVGDILTVAIFEQASASKEAKTSAGRKSTAKAGLANFFGLEKNLATLNGAIDPTSLIDTSYENDFEGSGRTSRKEDLVATLSTQVVEVLPNGNLRIEGKKTVTVNNEEQIVKLSGLIRQADISSSNVVNSQSILDARIAYTGKGVLSDKQKQGWLVRLLDHTWPF
ncbi:MAG: flagellar biosynthesis protein FlgH [Desulfuromonas sp.]|uniref:flagellar basal body L-ring protein FlgH n=1 Tax=Desulfuromonas sp. TaxID=892 RepID=UPI000CBE0A13|nr:flagellar basal body L-ring protein FlgH [Desulfuromonas sp.]PLX84474.1 MAG: flagellar biosynthesis protein FlgH [Desulfuromonas sp.]